MWLVCSEGRVFLRLGVSSMQFHISNPNIFVSERFCTRAKHIFCLRCVNQIHLGMTGFSCLRQRRGRDSELWKLVRSLPPIRLSENGLSESG